VENHLKEEGPYDNYVRMSRGKKSSMTSGMNPFLAFEDFEAQ
jgi:hypothetical protein